MGLVLEFEMWRHFDTKQKSKSFTLCDCIIYTEPKFLTSKNFPFDFMVYPDPKFLIFKNTYKKLSLGSG